MGRGSPTGITKTHYLLGGYHHFGEAPVNTIELLEALLNFTRTGVVAAPLHHIQIVVVETDAHVVSSKLGGSRPQKRAPRPACSICDLSTTSSTAAAFSSSSSSFSAAAAATFPVQAISSAIWYQQPRKEMHIAVKCIVARIDLKG